MMLQINKKYSLKNIQKQFNAFYPFLKIEFAGKIPVAKLHKHTDGFYNSDITIDISGKRTVLEVEKDFEKLLGTPVRIFRKSGNVWVETTLTDEWTLAKQNEEGEQISSHFK